MRSFVLLLLGVALLSFNSFTNAIDPTGTYVLTGKEDNGEIYGYFGEILVKKLSQKEIVMQFGICKGAPSYNQGSFMDTLAFDGTVAIYQPGVEIDSTCRIQFTFTSKGVTVNEQTADFNFGCGFGHAVVAHGFFKKTSGEQPEFTDN